MLSWCNFKYTTRACNIGEGQIAIHELVICENIEQVPTLGNSSIQTGKPVASNVGEIA